MKTSNYALSENIPLTLKRGHAKGLVLLAVRKALAALTVVLVAVRLHFPYNAKHLVLLAVIALAPTVVLVAAIHFPYNVDAPLSKAEAENNRKYYAKPTRNRLPERARRLHARVAVHRGGPGCGRRVAH